VGDSVKTLGQGNYVASDLFTQQYQFEAGMILSQPPIVEYILNEKKASYSEIPNIDEEISELIFHTLYSTKYLSCIFDDVSSIFTSDLQEEDELFSSYGMAYNKEVYYLLTKESSSKQLIEECLRRSNAFWHSLCVLTKADFNEIKKELTLEKMKDICLNTEMIIVGAYDSEGYVFWEK
jgi:hypothetical protein